jgi:protocatechuate 3,4-dioxygenase beta subunit
MPDSTRNAWSRRRFLQSSPIVLAGLLLPAWVTAAESRRGTKAAGRDEPILDPTPPCVDDDDVTPSETAGPFYTPDSPKRRSLLERGVPGEPIVVAGRVFSKACRPMAGVLVDFWHADGEGEYDNEGYRCRGHQFTDEAGSYHLETVVPGLYPGRTRHFLVRVQAPKARVLTTQLYFPGEPRNQRDFLYRPELLMKVDNGLTRKLATFDFVLDA